MYNSIQQKFTEAISKNKLFFTPGTESRKTTSANLDIVYTTVETLVKKTTSEAVPKNPDQSPWLPPDEDLLVKDIGDYNIVLNKFSVAKYHFLLTSKTFKRQSLPLSEEDWECSFKLLRDINKESGRRYIGFFNCGPKSGASISHKHLQFVPLPENFRPFPDTTKDVKPEGCVADDRVPFAHYIVGLPSNATSEDITFRYSEALGRVLTKISRSSEGVQRPEISYNLVFTEEWILATPRSNAKSDSGVSVNALGTIGMFLAKSDEERAELETSGFDLVKELGYEYEKVEVYAPDFKGYTHY